MVSYLFLIIILHVYDSIYGCMQMRPRNAAVLSANARTLTSSSTRTTQSTKAISNEKWRVGHISTKIPKSTASVNIPMTVTEFSHTRIKDSTKNELTRSESSVKVTNLQNKASLDLRDQDLFSNVRNNYKTIGSTNSENSMKVTSTKNDAKSVIFNSQNGNTKMQNNNENRLTSQASMVVTTLAHEADSVQATSTIPDNKIKSASMNLTRNPGIRLTQSGNNKEGRFSDSKSTIHAEFTTLPQKAFQFAAADLKTNTTTVAPKPTTLLVKSTVPSTLNKVFDTQECIQPSQTSSLFVSDTVNQTFDVSFGPLGGSNSAAYSGRCDCGNGTMYFYNSVSSSSWFDILSNALQSVTLTCARSRSMCVCDIDNICYIPTNASVHIVLASYCDKNNAICNMYMLVEGNTDDDGLVSLDGNLVIKSADQYAPFSSRPYLLDSLQYPYKKIAAIACGVCPKYHSDCIRQFHSIKL